MGTAMDELLASLDKQQRGLLQAALEELLGYRHATIWDKKRGGPGGIRTHDPHNAVGVAGRESRQTATTEVV
jgi:ABC-type nitrate/sulfonate/bicarbonate transport system ATPase subunit